MPVLLVNVTGFAHVPPPPLVLNVAVTLRAAVIDSVHPAVPVQLPPQPANVEPLAAVAVSVTFVLLAKLAVQLLPQLMPDGDEVTVPLPVPALVTASEKLDVPLNVAVTERAAVMDTVQVPVPVHAPLHPANVDPLDAAAVSVTEVPLAKLALQVDPQFTPAGVEVTVPAPVPALLTPSANELPEELNVAVTERACDIVTVQELVPVHAPLQPAKVEPLAAVAVSITEVPLA